jgi:hypothetical protein
MVPFREVRHFQPDDCLHYEPLRVRGRMHRWTIPAHRHEGLHQFELLERGSVIATIDGVSHSLTSPAAWMVSPGTMHGFRYHEASAGHVVTVPSAMLLDAVAALPHLPAVWSIRSWSVGKRPAPVSASCGSCSCSSRASSGNGSRGARRRCACTPC